LSPYKFNFEVWLSIIEEFFRVKTDATKFKKSSFKKRTMLSTTVLQYQLKTYMLQAQLYYLWIAFNKPTAIEVLTTIGLVTDKSILP